jgi:hypothetical protein
VYSSENLDAALDMAAKSFVAEEVKLYPDKLEVGISRWLNAIPSRPA